MPSDPPKPSVLSLENTCLSIEGRQVLGPITLEIAVGRLAIVGRNGSGKSTLSRLLAGLVAPSAGRIRLGGDDLFRDRRAALREVGILFQNPDHQIIFPTVREEIRFGLTQMGTPEAEADHTTRQVLARFGKAHWFDANVNTLSQGQKHLLCLMSVAAMAPRLLILDEPFAGLDLPTKMQLHRHLALYEGNIIHISHDVEDLAGCDHALWIDGGHIRATGPREQIVTEYVAAMRALGGRDDLAHLSG